MTFAPRPVGSRAGFDPGVRVAYCIGAQKAGTTWLYEMLRSCPDIHLSRVKEVHYWDTVFAPHLPYYPPKAARDLSDLETLPMARRLARRLRGTYGAALMDARRYDAMFRHPDPSHGGYRTYLMGEWSGQPVVGDISPGYAMMEADGFAEMDAVAEDVRFVFVMRDPVGRLWSNLRHNRSRNFMAGGRDADLRAAFRNEIETRGPAFCRSDYARTIAELESVIPRDRIGYFFYESLFQQRSLDRLADFLGIAPIRADLGRRVNEGVDGEGLPGDLAASGRRALSNSYDLVSERFGPEVPADWLSMEAQVA